MSIKKHNFNEPRRDRKLKTLAQYNIENEYESKTHKQFRFQYLITGVLVLIFVFLALFNLMQGSPSKMQPIKSQVDDMKIHLEVLEKSVKKGNNEMLSQIMEAFDGLGDQFNEMSGSVKSDMQRELNNLNSKLKDAQKAIKLLNNELVTTSSKLNKKLDSAIELQKEEKIDSYTDNLWYNILRMSNRGNSQAAKLLIVTEQNGPTNASPAWLTQRINEIDSFGIILEHLELLAKEIGIKKLDDERSITWVATSRHFLVRHRNNRTSRIQLYEIPIADFNALFSSKWRLSRMDFMRAMQIYSLYTTQFASALSLANNKEEIYEAINAYKSKGIAEMMAREKLQTDPLRAKQRFLTYFEDTQWYDLLKRELQLNNIDEKEKNIIDELTPSDNI
ncbi:MAG: hypothetical protein ACRC37_02530, partial [Lentisphaeria bacterium]